jgi:crotonobetaine/carnitine-CoA ligase
MHIQGTSEFPVAPVAYEDGKLRFDDACRSNQMTDDMPRPALLLQEFSQRTVPDLLDRSQSFGLDRTILVTTLPQSTLSYGALLERVAGAALVLAQRFAPHTRIACMVGNSLEYLIVRYALSCAGLVEVAINGRHKWVVLRHMLTVSNPSAIIVADAFRDDLLRCGYDLKKTELISQASLASLTAEAAAWSSRPSRDIRPGDACRILFTSGTSGWSKAVELSHAYEVYAGERHVTLLDIGLDDRWLYVTPMFHIDAIYIFSILLHTGAALALAPNFSASRFWKDVECSGATYLCYVGSILPILLSGGDTLRPHSLRLAVGGGATREQIEQFERRFDVKVLEAFAMTECIACTFNTLANRRIGTVGLPVPGYDVAILGRDGAACLAGVAGEIVVRAQEPCGMFTGYFGDQAATADAMRHNWFHTGDLGARDADGYFYYLGRIKDAIRVRGENVSAIELEAIADQHPDVAATAAVPVPAELGEDDILLYVEPKRGRELDGRSLFGYIADRVPAFMVPRYVQLVGRLPRTATEKIQKSDLPRKIDATCLWRDAHRSRNK